MVYGCSVMVQRHRHNGKLSSRTEEMTGVLLYSKTGHCTTSWKMAHIASSIYWDEVVSFRYALHRYYAAWLIKTPPFPHRSLVLCCRSPVWERFTSFFRRENGQQKKLVLILSWLSYSYDKESAKGSNWVSKGGESESGQMVLKKVKWTYLYAYLWLEN